MAKINEGDNKIMPILKLSYHNLRPSLKSCFSYCALFPKDFRLQKQMLIDLWMAHGYIVPLDQGQSIEDVAEDHFFILLRRCFFQDVEKNGYGEIMSIKIHDLMHDVAQEVMEEEIYVVTSKTKTLKGQFRHVNFVGYKWPDFSFCSDKIRSCLCHFVVEPPGNTIINNSLCLRVLDLSYSKIETLPDSIGELLHLRYLNMSFSHVKKLSQRITKLQNLQTLLLRNCHKLWELPEDFSNLVKLRHLDLYGCTLTGMPSRMDKLTSLTVLPYFVVGKRDSREEQSEDELKPL